MTFEQLLQRYISARPYQSQEDTVRAFIDEGIDPLLVYLASRAGEVYLRGYNG